MEIQIPLVLFIAFCAVSAGIFATQAVYALRGEAKEIQVPSLIASFVSLVIGGVAVLFHLAQPLHIFNGFGNPTSGITQELIAIVVLVVVMLVYFVLLRRNENQVPAWCAVVAIFVALVLDIVCAHSYMMASRPAWNSILQVLSVVGGSCAVGPACVAAIGALKKAELGEKAGMYALVGTIVGCVTTVVFLIALATTGGALTSMGTYLDPTNPTAPVFEVAVVSSFSGEALAPSVIAILGSAVAVVAAYLGKKNGNWALYGTVAAIAALVAIIALRVTFYVLGVSVYNFYGITG